MHSKCQFINESKYLSKVDNKGTTKTPLDAILVSLLLN